MSTSINLGGPGGPIVRVDPVTGGYRPEVVSTDETGAGSGGGGGASTIADGADVAQGAVADAAVAGGAAGSVSAKLRRLTTDLAALVVGVLLKAGEAFIGRVGGTTVPVSDEFARVADANAYLAGDAIGATVSNSGTTALRALANAARVAAGSGYIVKVRLWTDQKANVARHRIHFYTVAAPAAAVVGDNVPMQLLYANRAQRIGTIDLPAMATETDSANSTAAHSVDVSTRLAFKCAAADTSLYYRLQTLDAYTPASAQNYYLECSVEQN